MTDLLPQLVAYLLPFLLAAANGDEAAARQTATRLLEAYGPVTEPELILAAHTVAFSLAALESLRESAADPDMPAKARLQLHSDAEKLSRCADRTRAALRKCQARPDRALPAAASTRQPTPPALKQASPERASPEQASPEHPSSSPAGSQPMAGQEPESQDAARHDAAAAQDPAALLQDLPLSRQQRRFLERRAEKLRRAQQNGAASAQQNGSAKAPHPASAALATMLRAAAGAA